MAERKGIAAAGTPAAFRVALSQRVYPKSVIVNAGVPMQGAFGAWVIEQPYPEAPDRDMHAAFEIGVVVCGRQERWAEGHRTELARGDVYLNAAWEPHEWRTLSPGTILLVMHLLPEFLGEEALDGVSWLSLFAARPADRPRVGDGETRQEVLRIARDISLELERRRRGWLTGVRLGVLRLLFALAREWSRPEAAGGAGARGATGLARISPAMELVESNLGRRVSLGEAAAACALSPSQFSLLFRRTMGVSFGKFALRCRLGCGRHLLVNTDSPLEAIAGELGFVSASHFHHAFVKVYGWTPARYRDQARRRALTG